MSNEKKNDKPERKPDDMVKVRLKTNVVLKHDWKPKANGMPPESETTRLEAGTVIEMRWADAKKLIERSFDGYPNPVPGTVGTDHGTVLDPVAELVTAAA